MKKNNLLTNCYVLSPPPLLLNKKGGNMLKTAFS